MYALQTVRPQVEKRKKNAKENGTYIRQPE
jgi:hypothetical protein